MFPTQLPSQESRLVPSQRRLNRISRLTHWRVLHRASYYSCSDRPTEPGIWGHAYEVSEGAPISVVDPFQCGARTRRTACESAQSASSKRRGDPVGAPNDESTRQGRALPKHRNKIVKTSPRFAISIGPSWKVDERSWKRANARTWTDRQVALRIWNTSILEPVVIGVVSVSYNEKKYLRKSKCLFGGTDNIFIRIY